MPSFRSASSGVYRIRKRERGSAEEISSAAGETISSTSAERKRDSDMARKRGSSLPVQSTLVSVKVLPSRHSYFDADPKRIPLNVIETDYLHAGERIPDPKKTGENLKDREEPEPEDVEMNSKTLESVRRALIECIDQRIVAGTRSNGYYRLLLDADLLDKVSLDIVRMSDREPSGFNGCRLRTRLERLQSADMDFGCVRPIADASAAETFEIILSLKESSKSPAAKKRRPLDNVRSLLPAIFACHRPRLQQVEVHVGEAYQLEKVRFPSDRRLSSVACC